MTLSELQTELNKNYSNHEKCTELYNEHYRQAVADYAEVDCFNCDTVEIISSMAWERGHSYGYDEIVNATFEICEFVDRILAANKN